MKKVLVTGASGFLGSHICETLHDAGYEVHAVVRQSSSCAWLNHSWLKLYKGEFDDRTFLASILKGIEAVVHSAAELIGASDDELNKINVEATLVLAQESIKAGVKRFVFISSRDAGGFRKDAISKRESDPDTPYSSYGMSKKQAEIRLDELKDKITIINLRPVLIYGPRDRHFLRLFKLIKKMPLSPIIGMKPVYMPLVFVRDVAGAVLSSLASSVASGSSYYISDGMPLTLELIYRRIASSFGKKPNIVRVPAWVAAFIVGLFYGSRTKEIAFTPKTIKEFRHRYRLVSIEKARKELGWEPKTMLDTGIPLTTMWYDKEGWL